MAGVRTGRAGSLACCRLALGAWLWRVMGGEFDSIGPRQLFLSYALFLHLPLDIAQGLLRHLSFSIDSLPLDLPEGSIV